MFKDAYPTGMICMYKMLNFNEQYFKVITAFWQLFRMLGVFSFHPHIYNTYQNNSFFDIFDLSSVAQGAADGTGGGGEGAPGVATATAAWQRAPARGDGADAQTEVRQHPQQATSCIGLGVWSIASSMCVGDIWSACCMHSMPNTYDCDQY